MKKIIGLVVMVWLFAISSFASDNISIPNIFSSGSTISSSQMNENFNRLIELLDNQSKTIVNLETKLNSLKQIYFTEHPQYITLNYANGDTGNCETNNYDYITDIDACSDATGSNNVYENNNNARIRGCFKAYGNIYFNNEETTYEIDNEYPQQVCINTNVSL